MFWRFLRDVPSHKLTNHLYRIGYIYVSVQSKGNIRFDTKTLFFEIHIIFLLLISHVHEQKFITKHMTGCKQKTNT